MKKLFLFQIVFLMISHVFAQTDFVWLKIDSIPKTKSQIYSDTKLFIADYWKSSKIVIQNDNKDEGVILVNGKNLQIFNFGLCPYEYIYDYTVTFKMKDRKYKISIDHVFCSAAYGGVTRTPLKKIEPSDEIPYPLETGWLAEKRAVKMMQALKQELQTIVDSYIAFLKAQKTNKDSQ